MVAGGPRPDRTVCRRCRQASPSWSTCPRRIDAIRAPIAPPSSTACATCSARWASIRCAACCSSPRAPFMATTLATGSTRTRLPHRRGSTAQPCWRRSGCWQRDRFDPSCCGWPVCTGPLACNCSIGCAPDRHRCRAHAALGQPHPCRRCRCGDRAPAAAGRSGAALSRRGQHAAAAGRAVRPSGPPIMRRRQLDGPPPAGIGSKRLSNARLLASGFVPRWPDARVGYAALL